MFEKESVQIKLVNGILNAKIYGDIDHHCAKKIRDTIDREIITKKPSTVLLDLSSVEFMDSSGLGLILGRYTTATDIGADFKIYKPSKRVRKILSLAGIERLMKIEEGDYNEKM